MNIDEIIRDAKQGMRLSIELGAPVTVQLEGMEGDLKTTLVGMELDNYLMLRTPSMSGIQNKLRKGMQILVRFESAGSVFGFQTALLGHIVDPADVIFLGYPKIIGARDLRKHERVDCFIPAKAEVGERELRGAVINISAGGCRFTTYEKDIRLDLGDEIQMTFQILEVTGPQTFTGRVREYVEDRNKVILGIEFIRVTRT